MYGNFKYFRHDPRRDDEVVDAINELDGRVTALEDIDPGARLDAAEAAINENGMRIGALEDRLDHFRLHSHQSNVANYYVANYGSDSNDGSRAHPFRSLIPIFDPATSKVNLKDTAIRIDFLTTGTFQAFATKQSWPWFNGVFIRFFGPTRTTMPYQTSDLPYIDFNADAVSFSNSYLGFDYVAMRVGTGEYDPALGAPYNRMHLNNTSIIANMSIFNESRHSLHCGQASYVDCRFKKFGCIDSNVEFSTSVGDYSFTATEWDSPLTPLYLVSSLVRFDGPIAIQQPQSPVSSAAVYNHGSVVCFGGNIGYYGSGTAKYINGLASTYGVNLLSDVRHDALAAMGQNGNAESSQINLRVRGNVVIG